MSVSKYHPRKFRQGRLGTKSAPSTPAGQDVRREIFSGFALMERHGGLRTWSNGAPVLSALRSDIDNLRSGRDEVSVVKVTCQIEIRTISKGSR